MKRRNADKSSRRPLHDRVRAVAAASLASALIAGCGGGGSGSSSDPPVAQPLPASSTLASQCVAPRMPTPTQPYIDSPGTLLQEKAWVRSWIDETYLWYPEVPNIDLAAYPSAEAVFDVLKTSALTPTGNPKDRFHFRMPTPEWDALTIGGIERGYGILWALPADMPPRRVVVAQVDAGSPAAAAGLARGAEILLADGVDMVHGTDTATLNKALYPSAAGETHAFTVLDRGATAPRTVSLVAAELAKPPVPDVRSFDTPTGRVGYLLFTDHVATAEAKLVAAIEHLQSLGVTDLVLDLRYNGGGYLDIAAELAYMVAGPARTSGKVFEHMRFSDKNPFGFSDEQKITRFHASGRGFSVPSGQPLPTLNLGRVFVLTTGDTCSASESIINGLRGVGVDVQQVGESSCGKPYGFYPRDNCGTTYFAIQFEGVNDLGQGGYTDGLVPQCSVPDDFAHALGDTAERLLATALDLRRTGVCTTQALATRRAAPSVTTRDRSLALQRPPAREGLRILR